eukprot:2904226-Karenia_brevis.AAC.1
MRAHCGGLRYVCRRPGCSAGANAAAAITSRAPVMHAQPNACMGCVPKVVQALLMLPAAARFEPSNRAFHRACVSEN